MASSKNVALRGSTVAAVALLSLAGTLSSGVLAQSYPSRPVRVIVPFPPGSAPDQIMR
ncbi:MAG: tripartite tricarboxylate transporter substrate binding protein, partial [Rhodocyclaceae bacterium]|nr:tripartite tricarboxylate transporter substrate binding protein [Rhodocyclaceae bacterium]